MKARQRRQIDAATVRMLAPLVRLLLDHGIGAGELADLCKKAYVQTVAQQQRRRLGRINQSRIAIVTGLTRAEVKRLLGSATSAEGNKRWHTQRISRVLRGWRSDPQFRDRAGRPRALPLTGHSRSFDALVRKHGGDIPTRSMLDELLDSGRASITRANLIQLSRATPKSAASARQIDDIAARVSGYLAMLLDAASGERTPLFEATARASSINPEELPLLIRDLRSRGANLIASLDEAMRLASRGKPRKPSAGKARLSVTLFATQGED